MAWRFLHFVSVDGKVVDMRLYKELSSQDLTSALQVAVSSTSKKYSDHIIGNMCHFVLLFIMLS